MFLTSYSFPIYLLLDGMEPFYSVNDEKNMSLYQQYLDLANQESNLILGGHLAEYKYYDIAPIIEKVMSLPV